MGWEARTQKCVCEMGRLTQEAVYINKYMSHTGGKEWEFFGEGVYWWADQHERKNNKTFLEKIIGGKYYVSTCRGHRLGQSEGKILDKSYDRMLEGHQEARIV